MFYWKQLWHQPWPKPNGNGTKHKSQRACFWSFKTRRRRGEKKPETFTFLGFVHYCGQSPRGRFVIWRRTANERMLATLKQIKLKLRRRTRRGLATERFAGLQSRPCRAWKSPGHEHFSSSASVGCGAMPCVIAVSGLNQLGSFRFPCSLTGFRPRASAILTLLIASTPLIHDTHPR